MAPVAPVTTAVRSPIRPVWQEPARPVSDSGTQIRGLPDVRGPGPVVASLHEILLRLHPQHLLPARPRAHARRCRRRPGPPARRQHHGGPPARSPRLPATRRRVRPLPRGVGAAPLAGRHHPPRAAAVELTRAPTAWAGTRAR